MTDCTACANWTLKGSALAHEGMGNCLHLPRYQFVSIGCERLKPAESAVVEARVAWLGKLQIKPMNGMEKA